MAWKNKIRMKILDTPSCAHCNQQPLHIFNKSFNQATIWQWGGCTWTPPTCTCSNWPLSWVKHWIFPTIINENNLLAQWLSAKVAPGSQRCTCESPSVSYMNMLSACTWIYFCYFCHLCELIHFTWSIHCITLYYDFTYTHVAFNTCSNNYSFVTSNV